MDLITLPTQQVSNLSGRCIFIDPAVDWGAASSRKVEWDEDGKPLDCNVGKDGLFCTLPPRDWLLAVRQKSQDHTQLLYVYMHLRVYVHA